MMRGIQRDATWVHLWQQDCHGTVPLSFPSQEGVVVQKGTTPRTAAQRNMLQHGGHGEAQGKGQASSRKAGPDTKR